MLFCDILNREIFIIKKRTLINKFLTLIFQTIYEYKVLGQSNNFFSVFFFLNPLVVNK